MVVPGLGKFIEGKQRARKLEEEQKEREAKAFLLDVSGTDPRGPTVPQPFNLNTEEGKTRYRAEVRWQQLQEELRKQEQASMPFKPATNEGKRWGLERCLRLCVHAVEGRWHLLTPVV